MNDEKNINPNLLKQRQENLDALFNELVATLKLILEIASDMQKNKIWRKK